MYKTQCDRYEKINASLQDRKLEETDIRITVHNG